MIFLQENKLSVDIILSVASKIWILGRCQCVGVLGSSGGVTCLWDPKKISPTWWISCRGLISCVASHLDSGEKVFFSNIYASIYFQGKSQLWDHVRYVRSLYPYFPWILVGDCNDVISLEEDRGGNAHLEPSSGILQDNVALMRLVDIKPTNGFFTWNNSRSGDVISERLDRFLVSNLWIGDMWRNSSEILDSQGSNH